MARILIDIERNLKIVNIDVEINPETDETASIDFKGKVSKIDKSTQRKDAYTTVSISSGGSATVKTERGKFQIVFLSKTVRVVSTPDEHPTCADNVDIVIINEKAFVTDYSKSFTKVINMPETKSGPKINLVVFLK